MAIFQGKANISLIETKNGIITVSARSRASWRAWLANYHQSVHAVWLSIYKKESGIPSVYYPEAVDEALCFGWVDSKPNKRDDHSYHQFFSRRNPKSNWSKVNKNKVAQLLDAGLMALAGLEMVEVAKKDGTWYALDAVEALQLPDDLQQAFEHDPVAFEYWENFPKSVKRGILEWVFNAKKPETRQKRIHDTVTLAHDNIRANQYRPQKPK